MNDRSMAGTSLESGSIQLMQNRRVFSLDDKGVNEWMNERDENGYGIRVKATYYLQLTNDTN